MGLAGVLCETASPKRERHWSRAFDVSLGCAVAGMEMRQSGESIVDKTESLICEFKTAVTEMMFCGENCSVDADGDAAAAGERADAGHAAGIEAVSQSVSQASLRGIGMGVGVRLAVFGIPRHSSICEVTILSA